jgi:hypothetical protein
LKKRLLVYLPTYGRYDTCLSQAKNLWEQINEFDSQFIEISFHISINSDPNYNIEQLSIYCNTIENLQLNFGGNINFVIGFSKALEDDFDFFWLIGDDEPIPKNAISYICQTLISNPDLELLVGSKKYLGKSTINSLVKYNDLVGGTMSHITSVVYKVNYDSRDLEKCLQFEFSQFPHLVMLNRIVSRSDAKNVLSVPLNNLCLTEKRIHGFAKPTRAQMGYRDSIVFFGKPLSLLGVESNTYFNQEFRLWFLMNWHRISMYRTEKDFMGDLTLAIASRQIVLKPLSLISKFPYWRIKELLDVLRFPWK